MDRSILLSLTLVLVVQCYVANTTILNISSDQSALLALKACISDAPHNPLTSNWSTSTFVCNWIGVTCDSKHHRVIALNLSDMGLAGTISSHVGNLSFLVSLQLANNSFFGSVPSELTRLYRLKALYFDLNNFNGEILSSLGLLSRLQYLSLGDNDFTGNIPVDMFHHLPMLQLFDVSSNQFYGEVPSTFFKCKQLSGLILLMNHFTGILPPEIGNLTMLKYLDLDSNHFEGILPPEIGNLTMLKYLYLDSNHFEGAIPSEIGNLQNLEDFIIKNNSFTGSIPYEIFNISSLGFIHMSLNKLSGQLPSNLGLFLPNLRELLLWGNEHDGTIPSSISNASKLTDLDLAFNSFSGLIPKTIGNLRLLQRISLGSNFLSAEPSLFFYLSNCIHLKILRFSKNSLNCVLPNSIGNLSISLEIFELDDCGIKGSIPPNIGNLSNLISLTLGPYNELVGPIPSTMERLRKLQMLRLEFNQLEGPILSDLCQLKSLCYLFASGNKLSGQIPECISNLTFLREVSLSFNQLSSMVPLSLWSLTDLLVVDLESNFLSGSLSFDIGDMKVLTSLDLSKNQLAGDIPTTIGRLKDLMYLSLAENRLEGSIPESFGTMVSLDYLDLSNNELYGEIPKSLEALLYLRFLNVSFNKLRGKIPTGGSFVNFSATSFISNDALCGAPRLQVPPCKESCARPRLLTKILSYVLPTIGLLILIVSIVLSLTKCQKKNAKFSCQVDLLPLATWRRVSQQELQRATVGFNANNLIGEGSFGSVYKGILSDGTHVAIKVLHLEVEGAFSRFDAECQVHCNIRHRNLVKVISACSNMDFKAFVLEYMPNGNLEMWLYSNSRFLNLLQRLNTMIDVAAALEYLHFGSATPIVHCDLKPNNVLLDKDMVAHVADFGIARLLGDGDSLTQTMTLATIGYMAPEYGLEGIVSTRGDVYSYGILLMETFTRKRPTDSMFAGGMSLKHWIEESFPISVIEVTDANLLGNESDYTATEKCLSSILGLALGCCAGLPEERINMKNALVRLKKIKLKYLQDTEGDNVRVSTN